MEKATKRRAGGRRARHALRQNAAATPHPSPPGQIGGRYRPLSDPEIARIHATALRILDEIGMAEVPPVVAERALARGARLNRAGRLCFPPALVEDVIAGAARRVVLHGRDPAHDLEIGGRAVHYGTGGAAVRTLDLESARYRPSTLRDVYDFARLVDRLENITWFTRCCVATDLAEPLDLDINTAYAITAGTAKHVGTSFAVGAHVAPVVRMFDLMLGGDGRFAKRPFCKVHISPVVSPLRYGADAVEVMLACIAHRMPINAIIAAQSGATAPAPLAGMLAQTTAETLAGLLLVNLFAPGYPMIFSNWPFVIDLRSGGFSGGGGEVAVLNAAAAQIGNFYDLPSGVASSMSDAKALDAQAGFEKALTALAAGLAGANAIYESAGMMASLMGASFEAFVVDDEMLSVAQRVIRGIEVTEETLGFETIRDVVRGSGHFLGEAHTIAAMERDYFYPTVSDRDAIDTWHEAGATDIRSRARQRARAILQSHYPANIEPAADAEIRERFTIRLPVAAMGPK
jgi:trimethylamine--corrinoid protein Co-methyltransferase